MENDSIGRQNKKWKERIELEARFELRSATPRWKLKRSKRERREDVTKAEVIR